MDVVPADRAEWRQDPFGGAIVGGYVYGRGALDMKSMGIMELLALDLLRQSGRQLGRDVIWMAVADEEMEGGCGTGWMVEHHWDEIAPAVVWDEGGFGLSDLVPGRLAFPVAVAEKRVLWSRLVASGEPGLASVPRGKNPIDRLVRALARLAQHRFPPRLTTVTRHMFARLAEAYAWPQSMVLRHLDKRAVWAVGRHLISGSPAIDAMLRNVVTPTTLRAGSKENVIPGQAAAGLDIRLLPDEDLEAFLARLEQVIGDDAVRIEPGATPIPSSVSHPDGAFWRALAGSLQARVPESIVLPVMTPGASDSRFFRQRGVAAYGLVPIAIDEGELSGMHGIDERISIENLRLGTQVIYDVLCALCTGEGMA
jgi:acetylornithine deacetylase/succinyl-diaminopimelate desuccinylase-like protein